jgi:Amt family ammonium transporter
MYWEPIDAFWLFQGAFVIIGLSIVSGAVAERINLRAYLIFAVMMTAFIYRLPVNPNSKLINM